MPTFGLYPSGSITVAWFAKSWRYAIFPQPRPERQIPSGPLQVLRTVMRLALFDLDHTLLEGDTDELWGRILLDEGLIPGNGWARERARHKADYRECTLEIDAFIAFYSDSHNDLPLLEVVGRPVAVDPDPLLAARALREGWPALSLRTPAGA